MIPGVMTDFGKLWRQKGESHSKQDSTVHYIWEKTNWCTGTGEKMTLLCSSFGENSSLLADHSRTLEGSWCHGKGRCNDTLTPAHEWQTQDKTLQPIRSQLGYHVLFEEFGLKVAAGKMEGEKRVFPSVPCMEKKRIWIISWLWEYPDWLKVVSLVLSCTKKTQNR